MYVNALCTLWNTRRFSTGGSSTYKPSAGARTGIGRFVRGFAKAPGAFRTSYDAPPCTVWCPDGRRWSRAFQILNKIVRCPADFCKGRSDARPMSLYPQWPYRTPYGRSYILSITSYSPGEVCLKYIYNWLLIVRLFLPPTGAVESYEFGVQRGSTLMFCDHTIRSLYFWLPRYDPVAKF